MPLYKKIFIKELVPIFPSGNKIGKIFIFTRFEKFFHHKEAWRLRYHNDNPHESAAALFTYPKRYTSSRLGRHRLNIRNWCFASMLFYVVFIFS